ncbi:hypothetical protein E6O51_16615 [Pseudothauera rhizosphaerae]|uniref:DUF2946 domain-containing protein n=1 Tax=Pseudothauera rhizosphaerae TaxID=2565932 RepID=A0A4V6RX17_9RHOO|nr:hypothetical protein E6O51_16615 [Pseudothauera rhizosphaerae]
MRSSRSWRLALRLALFAVLAQLALGIASTQHQARMLAAGPQAWEAICTPAGIEYVDLDALTGEPPLDDAAARLAGGMQCAVCAAAALSAAPLAQPPAFAPFEPFAAALPQPIPAVALPAPALALRPPPRAPPALS